MALVAGPLFFASFSPDPGSGFQNSGSYIILTVFVVIFILLKVIICIYNILGKLQFFFNGIKGWVYMPCFKGIFKERIE